MVTGYMWVNERAPAAQLFYEHRAVEVETQLESRVPHSV